MTLSAPKVAGLILSAGESRRMGSPKALLDIRGETFLDHVIALFSLYCSPVIVVLGHEPEKIRAGLENPRDAVFVVNQDYPLGQLSSMQCGLRAVPAGCESVLFTLVDHPNVRTSTIEQLTSSPRALLSIPRYRGRRGHPMLFSRELAPDFLALPPSSQARIIIERHAADIRFIDVEDPGILDDVDDPEAYQRLVAAL